MLWLINRSCSITKKCIYFKIYLLFLLIWELFLIAKVIGESIFIIFAIFGFESAVVGRLRPLVWLMLVAPLGVSLLLFLHLVMVQFALWVLFVVDMLQVVFLNHAEWPQPNCQWCLSFASVDIAGANSSKNWMLFWNFLWFHVSRNCFWLCCFNHSGDRE